MILNISSSISDAIFLLMVVGVPLYGHIKKVAVFDSFVDGAKEGVPLIVKILPFLVGMIVAIGMLRASGAIDSFTSLIKPFLDYINFPTEIIPLAITRPFSGAASNAVLVDIIHSYGPDSLIARTAAVLMGSTETTFYVIAVYFGAVAIKKTRHAIPAGLIADFAGLIAAVVICRIVF